MTTTQREISPMPAPRPDVAPSNGNGVPVLPSEAGATPADDRALLEPLRAFHLGAAGPAEPPGPQVLPALLFPYRRTDLLRTDYPLYLRDTGGALDCRSLADQLTGLAAELGRSGGRLLEDNLSRIERQVRSQLADATAPVAARAALSQAAETVQRELRLRGDSATNLASQLAALVDAVPADALLLPEGDRVGLQLVIAVARAVVGGRRARFAERLTRLARELGQLLELERSKDPSARSPSAVAASLGGGSLGIDPSALSSLLGDHRGSARADSSRIERCQAALDALRGWLDGAAQAPTVIAVGTGPAPDELSGDGDLRWPDVRWIEAADPCAAADDAFLAEADALAAVLRAARLARLELDGSFEPELHGPWLAQLSWDGFKPEELALVTPVVALDRARALTDERLGSLSRLLRSGHPVKVLVDVEPAGDPAAGALGDAVRFELGYLGISHREALIHQTAAARPVHLVDGLRRALDATRPSIHILAAPRLVGGGAPSVGRWLHTGAAVDGRAHPLFCYDPAPGETWARRFDLAGNSEREADWPTGAIVYRKASGETATMELPFTFADFALLEPAYRDQLTAIPAGAAHRELVGVDAWLELADDEAARSIPFVWGVDEAHQLRRYAITRALAFACRDRRRYWRTLQEWAGLHNEHVERAVEAAVEAARAEREAEVAALEARHAEELDRVRRETAGEAMQRLASALLETDFDALAAPATARPSAPRPSATPAPAEAAAPAAEPEPEPEPEPAAVSFDDPYIDTPLCTTCNDCININPVMFAYDDNKQAYIADASAGTYEQLVLAAEKCPAACIHPGKPLDPNEPNLTALQERAAKIHA